jgi:uncharacterized glyoxalase superfamily protein PhnB
VNDINHTIEYYKELGFNLVMQVPEQGELAWAMMTCGKISFMFQTFESLGNNIPEINRKNGGSLLLYIQMKGLRLFYERIKDKVKILKEPEKTFYGAIEFSMLDINNYVLTFAEDE